MVSQLNFRNRLLLASVFAAACSVMFVGCQGPPQQYKQAYAQLLREKIEIEDEYYLLESDYIALKTELEKRRGNNNNGGLQRLEDQDDVGGGIPEIQAPELGFNAIGTAVDSFSPTNESPKEINPNEIAGQKSADSIVDGVANASNWVTENKVKPSSKLPRIVAVEIDRSSLRGINTDGRFGDDGFELILQPIDDEGGVFPEPADIMLTVIDPSLPKSANLVGQWSFRKEELETNVMDNVGDQLGIVLSASFDKARLSQDRLLVYVSYLNHDGAKLKTSAELQIRLDASQQSDRWTENRREHAIERLSNEESRAIPDWSPDR